MTGALTADELPECKDGVFCELPAASSLGSVLVRPRGFIFISMEDETGIANVIVTPDLYDRDRLVVTRSKFLFVEGILQNQDNVLHVKAVRFAGIIQQRVGTAVARFSLTFKKFVIAGALYFSVMALECARDVRLNKGKHGAHAFVITYDLSNPASAENLHAEVLRRGIKINALVNNAGSSFYGPFIETELATGHGHD
ncbi:hypothetical protein [Edaphobacter modestus]|uniref:hypothetical protein n=1 Tax=Edaphobacter modestus TaxID=388466 RepID=UPI001F5EFA35|nr:hypothetical protein [Edaphobacter modestus]